MSVTDPDGNTTTYTYNADNKLATQTSPTGGVTAYSYDLAGNLIQTVDPDGHTIQYGYDANNRLTTETWVNPSGGAPLNVIDITYNSAGQETQIKDDYSEYTYTYNTAGQLTSVDNAGTPDVPHVVETYTYNGAGNLASMTDNLGGKVSYSYNSQNLLASETQSGTGVDPERVDFTYDSAGNMTAMTRYSDMAGTAEVVATSYNYDSGNHLIGISDGLSDGTVVDSYTYILPSAGQTAPITQETRTWADGTANDTTDYTATGNHQLTSVTNSDPSFTNESFSYDANGNRMMPGYTIGKANQITSDGTYDYAYDADGNLISKTDIATGDETVYTYDFRNRLVEVQQVAGGVSSVVAQYTYDALNRRLIVSEGGTTTATVYDGTTTEPLLDFNGSGNLAARYLSGPNPTGANAVLARDTPSGGVAWYLTDRLGSVGDIVNNSGSVIDHIDYSAFGQVLDESNPSEGDRFKYAGMQYDQASGLYYDNARWYDAATGRFMTQDPMGFSAGDQNLYRYVSNQPEFVADPTGLKNSHWQAEHGNAKDAAWTGKKLVQWRAATRRIEQLKNQSWNIVHALEMEEVEKTVENFQRIIETLKTADETANEDRIEYLKKLIEITKELDRLYTQVRFWTNQR